MQLTNEAWLSSVGILKGPHLSWSALTRIYDDLSVVRVDKRLLAQPPHCNLTYVKAVVCYSVCDEYLNAGLCEHCAFIRHILGDSEAKPTPSSITSAAVAGQLSGAPPSLVLGSCRESEEAAEQRRQQGARTPNAQAGSIAQEPAPRRC